MENIQALITATKQKTESEMQVKDILEELQDKMLELSRANQDLMHRIDKVVAQSISTQSHTLEEIRGELRIISAKITMLAETISILSSRSGITIGTVEATRDVDITEIKKGTGQLLPKED